MPDEHVLEALPEGDGHLLLGLGVDVERLGQAVVVDREVERNLRGLGVGLGPGDGDGYGSGQGLGRGSRLRVYVR